MVMQLSEIEHREATSDEVREVINMELDEIGTFLSEATVAIDDLRLLVIIEGVAYHLEEITKER